MEPTAQVVMSEDAFRNIAENMHALSMYRGPMLYLEDTFDCVTMAYNVTKEAQEQLIKQISAQNNVYPVYYNFEDMYSIFNAIGLCRLYIEDNKVMSQIFFYPNRKENNAHQLFVGCYFMPVSVKHTESNETITSWNLKAVSVTDRPADTRLMIYKEEEIVCTNIV